MTPEDQPLTKSDLREALGHAVEVIADEFTGLRNEMNRRFDRVDQRFDSLDRRVERISSQQ